MATAFQIEKNVAPPTSRGGGKALYPFADMNVGDSFFVPETIKRTNVQNAAYMYACRKNVKFSVRAVEGGLRVWRVA
jgi:hypothetical protein